MEGILPFAAAIAPLPIAQILMHADPSRARRATSKIGQDDRHVADFCDDRVGLVGIALSVAAGMDMNVGDHLQTRRAAMRPQRAQAATVDDDDPGRQRMRIDIVVVDEFLDHAPFALPAEQEGSSLALSVGALVQLVDTGLPDVTRADEFGRRPEGDARER